VTWYPRRDTEWYPEKPTAGQVAIGALVFLALAGIALIMRAGEPDRGNRDFLLVMAGLMLVLASWRIALGVRLVREGRRARGAVRGP
jgi:hypothetical protein